MKKSLFALFGTALFLFGGFFGYAIATLPIARIIFAFFCIVGMLCSFAFLLYMIYKKDPEKPTFPRPETWDKRGE